MYLLSVLIALSHFSLGCVASAWKNKLLLSPDVFSQAWDKVFYPSYSAYNNFNGLALSLSVSILKDDASCLLLSAFVCAHHLLQLVVRISHVYWITYHQCAHKCPFRPLYLSIHLQMVVGRVGLISSFVRFSTSFFLWCCLTWNCFRQFCEFIYNTMIWLYTVSAEQISCWSICTTSLSYDLSSNSSRNFNFLKSFTCRQDKQAMTRLS